MQIASLLAQVDTTVLGKVSPPPGVTNFNDQAGTDGIGIIIFASNMIKFASVIAGLWVMFNFITAGYDYITAGDTKAHEKVKNKLTMSVLGLVIIVAAYTIAGLLGFILFNDPSYIINPKICGPQGCP
jgi:hypothetical protein